MQNPVIEYSCCFVSQLAAGADLEASSAFLLARIFLSLSLRASSLKTGQELD